MNIIIPMAGLGSRFAAAGFQLPKPLIPISNKPMYRYAVECLPLNLATNLIFILRRNAAYTALLRKDIIDHYANRYPITVITLDHPTAGQAETVLASADYVDLSKPTLIHNCDSMISNKLRWKEIAKQNIDGAIITFPSREARWSYIKLQQENVIDIAEKQIISHLASTGTYFFNNTHALLEKIKWLIQKNIREQNEYYLSSIYKLMLKERAKIINISIAPNEFICFGTPEDLRHSLIKLHRYY